MEIKLHEIPVREIMEGYHNNNEEGVSGYGGKLDIRPLYQREFIYDDKKRDAVLNTVRKGFPLNTMYWVKKDDGTFEVLDGQQRTISICEYLDGSYSINFQFIHNLTEDEKNQILDYKCMVYICEGSDREKLEWFRTINIAGMPLVQQELRNAVYTGAWLSDAKKYFSKTGCVAYDFAKNYMTGAPIRQDYLERVLSWVAHRENVEIEQYMAQHQGDTNAGELWLYFQNVINWVQVVFPEYRREMKGLDWGILYDAYHTVNLDAAVLEAQISELMMDDDVTKKQGIYEYVLTGKRRLLSLRAFTPRQKREAYEVQQGVCKVCGEHFEINEMEADHITPWSQGGHTTSENCQMLCKSCNREKSDK